MIRTLVFAFFMALTGILVSSPAGAASAGTRWALVVGIDRYDDEEISQLRFAVADARVLAGALSMKAVGFERERVFLMTSEAPAGSIDRPTRVNVLKRLDGLAAKIGPNDTFLFYFSGHGYQREEGRNFLGTIDAVPRSMETLQRSSLPLGLLREKIAQIRAHRAVFIIDACRNDPERSRSVGDNRLTGDFARDFVVVANAAGAGLAGTAVFFACSAGERAYEWNEMRHGVFSYYLLEGMRGKAAEPSGRLTMAGLGEFVQKRVMAWAEERGRMQRPDLYQQGAAAIDLASFGPESVPPAVAAPAQPPVVLPPVAAGWPPRVAVILPVRHGGKLLPDSAPETELIQQLLKAGFRVVNQMQYADHRQEWAEEMSRDLKVVPRVATKVGADIIITGGATSERGEDVVPGFVSCQARVEARIIVAQSAEIIAAEAANAPGAHIAEMAAANKALLDASRKLAPKLLAALANRK